MTQKNALYTGLAWAHERQLATALTLVAGAIGSFALVGCASSTSAEGQAPGTSGVAVTGSCKITATHSDGHGGEDIIVQGVVPSLGAVDKMTFTMGRTVVAVRLGYGFGQTDVPGQTIAATEHNSGEHSITATMSVTEGGGLDPIAVRCADSAAIVG
jgi:hypothetical protein